MAVPVGAALASALPRADGRESVPPGEDQSISQIVATAVSLVQEAAQAGEKPVLRDAHAKGHGCVQSTFKVRAGIPKALRQGVFARARTFPAWIRFSNGNGAPQNDHSGDGRGMAIKLIGVDGPKLLPDEAGAKTQDFVMINYPAFNIRDASDYVTFTALTELNRTEEFYATHAHEHAISKAITSVTVDQMFEQRYFSMTPYRLGKSYIKFSARPVTCVGGRPIAESLAPPPPGDSNYLRDGMIKWLAARDACFTLGVQRQTIPSEMPIEDPTIIWDEAKSPFVTVADIRIPRQQFAGPAQQTYCENLSFTPWHTIAAHEPVGGINRVRRAVYLAISTLRHRMNGTVRAEPTEVLSFN